MVLSIHMNTTGAAGFRKSLEGYSKAGIKYVEISGVSLDGFLKTESLPAANRLVKDLGLTPVCCTPGLADFWNPNPTRKASLEVWKRRCEQFATFGLKNIYTSANTQMKIKADDYKEGPQCIREAAEISKQFGMTSLIEFTRNSTYISTLSTLLKLTREAAHPNAKPMLDFYHFYSGLSKMDDLDTLKPGELGHCHFQDVPDIPRELLDNTTRLVPGEGIAPLTRILHKLAEKGYAGPLSVELFAKEFTDGDPYEVAKRIKDHAEPVMHKAKVW
jgi:2-keto-myo-inositol isomerase